MKENKINATYDPNQPRNRQNHTRFCNYCKRSGHIIAYCFEKKDMMSKTGNPLVIGTNLLIATDALDQLNTIDKTLPSKTFGAEPETFFRVITKIMTIIIVLSLPQPCSLTIESFND